MGFDGNWGAGGGGGGEEPMAVAVVVVLVVVVVVAAGGWLQVMEVVLGPDLILSPAIKSVMSIEGGL